MSPSSVGISGQPQASAAMQREWLLTNGLGGFASGTVAGVNTRRYHGLLVAATLPPVGRIMTVARTVDLLWIGGRRHDFSAAIFGDQVVGDGLAVLKEFELAGETAGWRFEIEGIEVEKRLLVCWHQNAAGIRYLVRPGGASRGTSTSRAGGSTRRRAAGETSDSGGLLAGTEEPVHSGGIRLEVLPLIALRDFHALRRKSDLFGEITGQARAVTLRAEERSLRVEADAGTFRAQPDWWLNHTYPLEADRGLDDTEDLFAPGSFEVDCDPISEISLSLWIHFGREEGGFIWNQELDRRQQALAPPPMRTPAQHRLARAAADFIVQRSRPDRAPGVSVIAGYPWFADWGRDTFIALPGLLLCTQRFDEAREVLATFAAHVSGGMIPNRFNDYTSEPEYNTVDASLWFIHAAHEYARASGDSATFDRLLCPACDQIVAGYTRGTRYGIHVDPADGLVAAGDAGTQLTWMDARRDGVVFTPRHGKAVEINALWHSSLVMLGHDREAARVRESFQRTFAGGSGGGLIDVVSPAGERDTSIRPNQIFAVWVPHTPLDRGQQRGVVEVVRQKLLTPFGLRTLAPNDPKYQARFAGPLFERDRAYHNGTVWPWLMGPFIDAFLKVNQGSPEAILQARAWLAPLLEHFESDACAGSISEVFDAEPPHHPGGCFAQAWSVAEVLRLAVELKV